MITSAQTLKQKADSAKARGNIYKLLSTAFGKELSKESLEALRENSLAETLKDLGIDLGSDFYDCDTVELVKKLSEEYAALFILPGGVNPTESVHRVGLYMQTYAGQAQKFYKECGFVLPDDFKGFPDHIGIELELMSRLSGNEAAAYEGKAEDEAKKWIGLQKRFLHEHLSKWALDFATNIAMYARQPFYKEMAGLLYEFVILETEGPAGKDG